MSKNKQNLTFEQRVLEYIQQNNLIPPHQKIVVVAVSGGPDSVCLLHTLHQFQNLLGISLHVAHLNHQLRGEESELDASFVSKLAQNLNLPITVEKADVTRYQKEFHLSLEEAAREVRYRFLAGVANSLGTDLVAVGHTLNDQVETILLHIIRGAGTRGLRGLQAVQELKFNGIVLTVIRPLLEIQREETEEYCQRFHLQPRSDSSNFSLSMLRNRVRRELLPILKNYNPGVSDAILRISSIAQDDLEFLESEGRQAWNQIVRKEKNTFIFEKKTFKVLASALKRQLLRTAIDKLLGTLKDIETRHIEEIMKALNKPPGRQITLPEGLVFNIDYDSYSLSLNALELAPFPILADTSEIKIPGETRISGWLLKTTLVSRHQLTNSLKEGNRWTASFDKDIVGNKLLLRNRRRGDTFQPLGMSHTKKVGEFMLDARIPRSWRDRIPIICTPIKIIWVAGYRIDENVKVTPETKRFLTIKMTRTDE
jgi:tRNA(Ile)-lysidine synthase